MALGNRLREVRKAKGIKLRQVSRDTGIDSGQLSWMERGVVGCSDERKVLLSKYYDVPVMSLFFQTPVENQEAVPA